MTKNNLILGLLAFAAGVGVTTVIMKRDDFSPPVQESLSVESAQIAPQEKTEKPKKKDDKDEDDDDVEDLDGNYADPATCEALYNADTYAKDEDFMFMLPGKDGWVYRTRQDLQMAFDLPEDDIPLYSTFVSALKAHGTELVIAYIPTRGMIATEYLPQDADQTEDYDAASARENYNTLIARMGEAGVNFVGTPQPASGANYFNHADQHWTTKGSRDMAQAIADFVKDKPFAAQLPKQVFKTTIGEEIAYDGRFGEFIKGACGFRPPPEKDNKVKTERVSDGDEAQALLGEEAPPQVVLVGTSNSIRDEFNSNFDGFLKEALSTDVYNAAISGGGMDDAILTYLSSERFRKTPPRLLVWELPGYYDMGGAGMEYTLRQAVGGALGDCDKPLATYPKAQVVGKKVFLFDRLEEMNVGAGQAYVAIRFEEPVSKDFSISIKTLDKKSEKFKFTKRREGNGDAFYYLPKGGEALLSSIALNVNKNIDGLNVEAKLCPVGVVVPAAEPEAEEAPAE